MHLATAAAGLQQHTSAFNHCRVGAGHVARVHSQRVGVVAATPQAGLDGFAVRLVDADQHVAFAGQQDAARDRLLRGDRRHRPEDDSGLDHVDAHGRHGIGRDDIVENRFVGMKSRGVYETPGGTILRKAHMAIESITMDREVMHLRDSMIPRYAEMIYYGFWFSPERELLQKMIDDAQQGVNGVVRLELYKGNCRVIGRKSENSLYNEDFATFEDDTVYQQQDAEGFIRLNALRLRIRKLMAGS